MEERTVYMFVQGQVHMLHYPCGATRHGGFMSIGAHDAVVVLFICLWLFDPIPSIHE